MNARRPGSAGRSGFTLVEMVVVLVLIGLAVGLSAPAFLSPPRAGESSFGSMVRRVRTAAVRRGETLRVTVDASGRWRVDGVEPGDAISTGTFRDYRWPGGVLWVSPVGTCAFDRRSGALARRVSLDPVLCAVEGG